MSVLQRAKQKYQSDGIVSLMWAVPSYVWSRCFHFMPDVFYQKYKLSNKSELHYYWKNRDGSVEKNNPENYLDPLERSEFLLELISPYINKDSKILEPGCNVGRNLDHFYKHGYKKLSGIEINPEAIEILKKEYPDLAADVNIHQGDIESHITEFESGEFDVVFTMAVLEHIHPDSEFVFEEIARVASEYVVTIEDEGTTSHRHVPRNYEDIFTQFDFELIESVPGKDFPNDVDLGSNFAARVFRKHK